MTRLFDRKIKTAGTVESYGSEVPHGSSQIARYRIGDTKHPGPRGTKDLVCKTISVRDSYTAGQLAGKPESEILLLSGALLRAELYKSWLGRLHIGPRIPKYSQITDGAGCYLLSREVPKHRTLNELDVSELITILGRPDNLKALADMLVFAIVFKENDFKFGNILVDSENNLTRIDFEQVFYASGGLEVDDGYKTVLLQFKFSHLDFENLPFLKTYHPYNFAFYCESSSCYDGDAKEDFNYVFRKLGSELRKEVCKSILKILLMPDFLNLKLYELYRVDESETLRDLFEKINRYQPDCSVFLSQKELFSEMKKSEMFKAFLRDHGAAAMAEIKKEIKSFRDSNSDFRKSWEKKPYEALVDAEVDQRFAYLRPRLLGEAGCTSDSYIWRPLFRCVKSRGAVLDTVLSQVAELDRSLVLGSVTHSSAAAATTMPAVATAAGARVVAAQGVGEINLVEGFVEKEIARLNRTCFARGRETKIKLLRDLKENLVGLKANPQETGQLSNLCRKAAVIAFHRRSMSSHAFGLFKTATTGWRAWSAFCHENGLAEYANYAHIESTAENDYACLRRGLIASK